MKHTPEPLSNVPRWVHRNIGPEFEHPNGEWVRYEDVAAEIARLREAWPESAIQECNGLEANLREALDALEGLYARLNRPDDATDARTILTKHGRAV